MKNITFVIPTYKNKEQLLKNIEHNRKYWKNSNVIVVNDFPGDDLRSDIKQFKEVTLIQNEKNLGFAGAIDKGIRAARSVYVIMLNSDVLLKNDSFLKAVKHFENNDKLFAVSFAQKEKDGHIVGKNSIHWKNGLVYHMKAENMKSGSSAWAEGGSSMIDREKYETLEGFDTVFSPFYWEDIDLSYRAKKAGFEIYFDEKIVVDHHHESTIGKYFQTRRVKNISFRNQFLFIWKNISTPSMMIEHLLFLIPNIIYYLVKGEYSFLTGLLLALPKIIRNYKVNHLNTVISDREILCS